MAPPATGPKRPTQADVARCAAVSQPVVSYVLRGDPLAPVAPVALETRRPVEAVIAELGDGPDRATRPATSDGAASTRRSVRSEPMGRANRPAVPSGSASRPSR